MRVVMAMLVGFVLDLVLGDPEWMPHPVRLMGKAIAWHEKLLRRLLPKTPGGERVGGILLAILIPAYSVGLSWGVLALCGRLSPWLRLGCESWMCYQILAVRGLRDESMRVYRELTQGSLEGARRAVSRIVGRDTQELTESGVTKAAVETIAENASDGVAAPLFFLALGGAPLGFFCKAVNTMDSMVGYKNERHRYFGTGAAKLDDAVNFLPSRLCGVLMTAASPLVGLDGGNAWRIFCRDRKKHASPNSAQTEAAMAGALGVQLAGDAYYFGQLHKKPTLGDDNRTIQPQDIPRANRLLYATAVLTLLLLGGARMLVLLFCR